MHERPLEDIIADYLDELDRGITLEPMDILAEHPERGNEIIESLREFMNVPSVLEGAALGTLGDYTLRRQIGRGGMGVVYEAWQSSMDRVVALKVLPPAVAADDRAYGRFMQEARAAGKLRHPNVVAVHAAGFDENTPYYAMEFVEGDTLAQVLARLKDLEPDSETPLGPKDQVGYFANLANVFADVADGLQHAHSKGVTHRDIKPSNLILDREGSLRILDFGLARLDGHESLTISGDVVGTPVYMSPEQARRRKVPVDHRTDVYSLGATMFEALTGTLPFRGKDHADTLTQIIERDPTRPRRLNARVPSDLETIVLKCLRKDPGDRFGTAEALAQDLRRFVRGQPIEARPQALWERLGMRLRRHRVRAAVVSTIALLLLIASWQTYRSELARYEAQQARYETAVFEVLKRIYAGQFSPKAVAGETRGLFELMSPSSRLSPLTSEDFTQLYGDRDVDPLEEALAELAAVAEALPDNRDAHYHLANAYRVLERPQAATRALEETLRCDPAFVPALLLRGESFETVWAEYRDTAGWERQWLAAYGSVRREDWSEAVRAYVRLIAIGKKREPYIGALMEAHLACGVARLEMRDFVGAQRDLTIAGYLAPGFEPALLLGKAYHLARQRAKAEDIFEELYESAGSDEKTAAVLSIIAVYDSLRDDERALAWVERLGEEVVLKDRLKGYFLYFRGNWREAIDAARRAVARNRQDLIAHLVLGRALLEDFPFGSRRDARRALGELLSVAQTAASLDPDNEPARRLLARAEQAANHELRHFLRRYAVRTKGDHAPVAWMATLVLGLSWVARVAQGDCGIIFQHSGVTSEADVAVSGDYAAVGSAYFSWPVRQGAVLVLRRDGESWLQQAKLTPPGTVGWSVAIDGDRLAASTYAAPGQGTVYVFRREGTDWIREAELTGTRDVSLSGDWLVTASPPQVFRRAGTSWSLHQAFTELAQPWSAAIDGDVAAVGNPETGQVAVYRLFSDEGGPEWELETELLAWDSCRRFGSAVSVSGDVLVVGGAPDFGNENCGRAYVFRFDGAEWIEEQELVGSDTVPSDYFGTTVAVSGDLAIVGAPAFSWRGAGGSGLGYVSVFRNDGEEWYEESTLTSPGVGVDEGFGRSIGLSGGTVILQANGAVHSCDLAPEPKAGFLRGDSNLDGRVNLTDGVATLAFLFVGDGVLPCLDAADADDSGKIDIADGLGTFNFLFLDGAPPAPPGHQVCGVDPTDDGLDCEHPLDCQ